MRVFPFLTIHFSSSIIVFAHRFGYSPCYYANGTQITNSEVRQCSSGVETICCTLDRLNEPGSETNETGWTQDECLPNGLCQNRRMQDGVKKTRWWLEYCTDPDISSSNCLDICRHTRDAAGGSRMTPCGFSGDGSYNALDDDREITRWCCGDSDACCTNDIGVIELPKKFTGRAIRSSVSVSTPTSSPSVSLQDSSTSSPQVHLHVTPIPSTTTTATLSTTTASEADKNELPPGVRAGIAVGATVGGVAILLAAFFGHKAIQYRKLAKARQAEDAHAMGAYLYDLDRKYANSGYAPSELTATSPAAELPTHRPSKMP